MVGREVFEEVDVAGSARTGRLVLTRKFGGDYDAAALVFLAVAVSAGWDLAWYRSPAGNPVVAAVLFLVPISLAWVGVKVVKLSARSRELIPIAIPTDAAQERKIFIRLAEELGWEENRNNAQFARYVSNRHVVTVLFRRDHLLLNCRGRYSNRMRVPIGLKERDEVVRIVSRGMEAGLVSSNPALNPTTLAGQARKD